MVLLGKKLLLGRDMNNGVRKKQNKWCFLSTTGKAQEIHHKANLHARFLRLQPISTVDPCLWKTREAFQLRGDATAVEPDRLAQLSPQDTFERAGGVSVDEATGILE